MEAFRLCFLLSCVRKEMLHYYELKRENTSHSQTSILALCPPWHNAHSAHALTCLPRCLHHHTTQASEQASKLPSALLQPQCSSTLSKRSSHASGRLTVAMPPVYRCRFNGACVCAISPVRNMQPSHLTSLLTRLAIPTHPALTQSISKPLLYCSCRL